MWKVEKIHLSVSGMIFHHVTFSVKVQVQNRLEHTAESSFRVLNGYYKNTTWT